MVRWTHAWVAWIVSALLIAASSGSAFAQPAAGAKGPPPSRPRPEATWIHPVQTFCSQADKDKTIEDLETEIGLAKEDVQHDKDYSEAAKAYYAGDPYEAGQNAAAAFSLSEAQKILADLERQLASAKQRPWTPCRTAKDILPPFPKIATYPFTEQHIVCDPAASQAYIDQINAGLAAEQRNNAALNVYVGELIKLNRLVIEGPPKWRAFKKEVFAADDEGLRVLMLSNDRLGELQAALAQANADAAVKCPPKTAPQPGPKPPVVPEPPGAAPLPEPGPNPPPLPPGATPDPGPKKKPTFPLPGPLTPPTPAPGPTPPPPPKKGPTFPVPQPLPPGYTPPPETPPPADGPRAVPFPAPEIPLPPPGAGFQPWTPHRPPFADPRVPEIPAFCDEFARNAFLKDVLLPALAKANHDVELSDAYLSALNNEFTAAGHDPARFTQMAAIRSETIAMEELVTAQQAKAAQLQALYTRALNQPLDPNCPKPRTAPQPPPSDGPKTTPQPPPVAPDEPKAPALPKEKVGCDCPDRTPITVGPNNRVGSGARTREKAVSTAMGLVGGLIGGHGGGGGGGGGSDGPQLVTCRISDKEMTVFDDPATGTSLSVGAKRAGDKVVVFANVAKSPDDGSFQAAYLQDGDGARQAPGNVGICDLWGEWKLTVSWTRTTYVNDQVVSRESGGWSKEGSFHIPGTLSSAAAPDGLWKRLGFSNASHGARKIALTYDAPRAKLAQGPLGVVIHVARPGQDPVTTVPFALRMREGPNGFVFEKAPACTCGGAVRGSFTEVPVQETEVAPIDYRDGTEDATRRKTPGLPKPAPKPAEPPKTESPHEAPK